MKIPIRNIYYMLCYAWQHLESMERSPVASVSCDNVTDLFARILRECVTDIYEKGLFRDYIESTDEVRGIKGKMQVTPTIQKSLLRIGRSICTNDEYSLNNRLNQIVLSTVSAMMQVSNLNQRLKMDLEDCFRLFPGVDITHLAAKDFFTVRVTRLCRHYEQILRVCALIWEQLAPDESNGNYVFEEFDRDERKMRRVFEDFVRNFFKFEGAGYNFVKTETIRWQVSSNTAKEKTLLPVMKTDTSLISPSNYTVIETKFVSETLQQRVPGSEKIRSGHLYQLMAYLENIRRGTNITPRGILLYPQVDRKIAESYRIWDFDVLIRTVDLTQDWAGIRRDLLDMVRVEKAE